MMFLKLLLVLIATHEVIVDSSFVQDRFVISFWVDPIVSSSEFNQEYRRIVNANFTALVGGFGALDPMTVAAQLQACTAVGLACIPSSCETAEGPGPHGSCVNLTSASLMGFQMTDEPSAAAFPSLQKWSDSIAQRNPSAARFINLLPNYATPAQLGTSSYGEYVAQFVTTVQPNMLCVDHYPNFGHGSANATGNKTMAGYHRNLAVLRDAALKANIPFWNFFNIMPYNSYPDVTESQARWQVFTSLGYGAKGLLYFTYWWPNSGFPTGGSIITTRSMWSNSSSAVEYVPSEHYAQAQRINAKLRIFGEFLLTATSTCVEVLSSEEAGTTNCRRDLVRSVGGSGEGPTWSFMLGYFALPSSASTALVLHNQDPALPALATLEVPSSLSMREIDPMTGEVRSMYDDAPLLPGLQVRLVEGDARLFVFL